MIFFFKFVYFKHVKSVLLECLERKYFSVHIAILYKVAIHSCKFFLCFFFFFFFCKLHCFALFVFFFTKCTVLNGDVANNYVLGL